MGIVSVGAMACGAPSIDDAARSVQPTSIGATTESRGEEHGRGSAPERYAFKIV
jgi:hypothetical protein